MIFPLPDKNVDRCKKVNDKEDVDNKELFKEGLIVERERKRIVQFYLLLCVPFIIAIPIGIKNQHQQHQLVYVCSKRSKTTTSTDIKYLLTHIKIHTKRRMCKHHA